MPVYKLLEEMPYEEYLKWITFFNKRPVGWREDKRAAMIIKAQGVKASEEELFPTLKIMRAAEESNQKPDQAVPKGVMLGLMSKAKGGDAKLDIKTGAIIQNG